MINIALDGPSGSGKGALADGIAKKMNIIHVDTGAIFRTIAIGFLKKNLTNPTEDEVKENISKFLVKIEIIDGKQTEFLNGEDVTPFLRKEEVSKLASKTSAIGIVREKYLEIVSEFAKKYDCIIDGRDITSVVLPNADCKIYLTADAEVRARRRYAENIEKNISCTFEEVFENLKERDYRDSHRDIAPLVITDDAFVIDNTNLTIDETIEKCYEYIVNTLDKIKGM